ncbi:DUF1499 domain-containing protein [Blastochloris viridis]|uniref:DUF1499 domain-containing protein n=1 Tax=Blastochloris viridis TaxID=1079 RepID=A0A0H5BH44_BLAVI|nr:DUF1499 domain-containing protein [Blastochloris viridis]ALK09671.1 hypothetical protein BVIR_1898 [Blastochloris viridis]BAS00440.1 hypothetical protein BV133_2846 [Blastochloris viridis]CUU42334.1 hypothetical protein BVIRIDIS_13430 [Blastochloris viridis]
MVRRRAIPVERYSQLAIWSQRLALFSLPVVALGILMSRLGLVETVAALGVFAAGVAVAALAVLVALAALAAIWNDGYRGLGRAVAGLMIGLLVVVGPAAMAAFAYRLPAIHDVTTDLNEPPSIIAGAVARSPDANPPNYPGPETAALQRAGYPDLKPLLKDWPPEQAFQAARDAIEKRRWRVLDQVAPRPGRDGRIEAVVRTLVFGFRDDVVVRIRATAEGSRIDVRSASRIGLHDLGANARRIKSLLADIDEWQPPRR